MASHPEASQSLEMSRSVKYTRTYTLSTFTESYFAVRRQQTQAKPVRTVRMLQQLSIAYLPDVRARANVRFICRVARSKTFHTHGASCWNPRNGKQKSRFPLKCANSFDPQHATSLRMHLRNISVKKEEEALRIGPYPVSAPDHIPSRAPPDSALAPKSHTHPQRARDVDLYSSQHVSLRACRR